MGERAQDWPTGGLSCSMSAVTGRLEDYAELRTSERLSVPHAAERMGISIRTARRYEARLIAKGATRIGTGLALTGQENT